MTTPHRWCCHLISNTNQNTGRGMLFPFSHIWLKGSASIPEFPFIKQRSQTNRVVHYSIHVPGWLQKWLNLITAPGSVSNEPGSVTWLATNYLKTVSWRNHTEKLTTWWPQNISFWPKINIPSSYFTILMLNCLENTLKLQFDSYVTAVRFLT